MAQAITIARPYAQAVFKLAQSQQRLAAWSDMVNLVATVVTDPRVSALIGDPKVPTDRVVSIVLGVCEGKLDQAGKNYVHVLADNDRLMVADEIAAIYAQLRADAERTVKAELVSATAADAKQQAQIVAALKKRLQREVELTCRVDPALIGGAVVRAGDLVIDGSVSGQLQRLAVKLSH